MPAQIDSQILAELRHFATGGDRMSQILVAILAGTYSAQMSAGVEGSNVIRVSGQVQAQDGTPMAGTFGVLLKSYPPAGAGTMAVVSTFGTAKKGSGTTELWLETKSDGSFKVDVTDVSAEDCLIRAETDNGEVELLKLTFA
jgi:hypothetical protein